MDTNIRNEMKSEMQNAGIPSSVIDTCLDNWNERYTIVRNNHKFKPGDIVKHRGDKKRDARKLVITAAGTFVCANGNTEFNYSVSFVKNEYVPNELSFGRAMLDECELEIYE